MSLGEVLESTGLKAEMSTPRRTQLYFSRLATSVKNLQIFANNLCLQHVTLTGRHTQIWVQTQRLQFLPLIFNQYITPHKSYMPTCWVHYLNLPSPKSFIIELFRQIEDITFTCNCVL